MRRIVMWLMSTATGVVLLFGYHTSTSGPSSASGTVVIGSTSTASTGTAGSSPASTAGGTTVTGDTVQTRWGPVEVEITVANGSITAVDVPVYPDDNSRDREINTRALPTLVQETLAAQGSAIDMVSGATFTSDGYLESLQSALDKAGL